MGEVGLGGCSIVNMIYAIRVCLYLVYIMTIPAPMGGPGLVAGSGEWGWSEQVLSLYLESGVGRGGVAVGFVGRVPQTTRPSYSSKPASYRVFAGGVGVKILIHQC